MDEKYGSDVRTRRRCGYFEAALPGLLAAELCGVVSRSYKSLRPKVMPATNATQSAAPSDTHTAHGT